MMGKSKKKKKSANRYADDTPEELLGRALYWTKRCEESRPGSGVHEIATAALEEIHRASEDRKKGDS